MSSSSSSSSSSGSKARTVLTCFAGRQSCMRVLLRYVRRLLDAGAIDEFHAWNFSRQASDDAWLWSQFVKPHPAGVVNTPDGTYVPLDLTLVRDVPTKLFVRGRSDAHIKLVATGAASECCELVLGGWANAKSAIRRRVQGAAVQERGGAVLDAGGWVPVTLCVRDGALHVDVAGVADAFQMPLEDGGGAADGYNVHVAGWPGAPCMWSDRPHAVDSGLVDDRMQLMHVHNRGSWAEYYRFYNRARYPNPTDVIIKCDDDIVYIDVDTFGRHMQFRRAHPEFLLVFPGIVNNEMCAFYQQQAGLIPADSVGPMHGEPGGSGSLWKDGHKTARLHAHFCSTSADFRARSALLPHVVVPIDYRVSINFFSVLARDLDVFQMVGADDEEWLTQKLPGALRRAHAFDLTHVVAHLSFFKQLETGLDRDAALKGYEALADAGGV